MRASEPGYPASIVRSSTPTAAGGVTYSVLVVDDKLATAEAVRDVLKDAEPTWDIAVATNHEAAMKQIRDRLGAANPFSVVITDLDLDPADPGTKSGLLLIRAIQAVDPLAMTILYTGYEHLLEDEDVVGLGAFDVVVKTKRDGMSATNRIIDRTRTAVRHRDWAVRISTLRRFFDPKVFDTFHKDPSLLTLAPRRVTIAFWDIRGFSRLCDELTDEWDLIGDFLGAYSDLAARTILEHGGILDKFVGDRVMALFGVLNPPAATLTEEQKRDLQANAAVAAVNTALTFAERFLELIRSPRWKGTFHDQENPVDVRLACGIHTGKALVGILGTQSRDQFTALGSRVNRAHTLATMAGREDGQEILVSHATNALVYGIGIETKLVEDRKDNPKNRIYRVVRSVASR